MVEHLFDDTMKKKRNTIQYNNYVNSSKQFYDNTFGVIKIVNLSLILVMAHARKSVLVYDREYVVMCIFIIIDWIKRSSI